MKTSLILTKKKQLSPSYNPQEYEASIYREWETSGYFNPDKLPGVRKSPFCLMMPPPNATGVLHLGHAMEHSLHDVIIRYHRMKGEKTLWVPGIDHAAIATQTKVEKLIAKEGKTRQNLGREQFLKRVNQYVQESKTTIELQLRKLGASCDWSRESYTLSPILTKCVQEVFVKMYHDGLIVRGNRLVHWCPRCESTLADDEVEYQELPGTLYYIEYRIKNSKKNIVIATTRPETMLGDTAVAVHHKDKRYQNLIGKTIQLPFSHREIPIIADRYVDPDFGTGAVKITPAHDFNDDQMAKRHGLSYINIINPDGTLNEHGGKYQHWAIADARKMIVEELNQLGLLKKTQDHIHNVGHCYRCDAIVEPYLSLQWFIAVHKPAIEWKGKTRTLKEVAIDAVKSKDIKIIPNRFNKTYFHWINNLQDWCISRQIWFGHRIPVWYCKECVQKDRELVTHSGTQGIIVSLTPPTQCPDCKSKHLTQDLDTLDTWFSAALWTFSTLLERTIKNKESLSQWIKRSSDFKTFHPTNVMAPGYEILFFWVARMILMTTYNVKQIPFKLVYLHGIVRDKEGKKMSKTRGNGIDPVDMIKKYGTDALRLSLIIGSTPGNDIKMYEEKIEGCRNFINKLWNISRFIFTTVQSIKLVEKKPKPKTISDDWILTELEIVIRTITKHMEQFEFSAAGEKLRDFTWDKFADWYVEIAKIEQNKDEILLYILQNLLRLWHPFIPFITERIWAEFTTTPPIIIKKEKSARSAPLHNKQNGTMISSLLIIQPWPKPLVTRPSHSIKQHAVLRDIISAIRNARAELKVAPLLIVETILSPISTAGSIGNIISNNTSLIEKLARVTFIQQKDTNSQGHTIHEHGISITLHIPRDDKKIKKEKQELEKYIKQLQTTLANEQFIQKAPKAVIETERAKLQRAENTLQNLQNS